MKMSFVVNNRDNAASTEITEFRRFASQFVATTVKNCLLVNMGLSGAFIAIVIPALTGVSNSHNINESLSLTSTQASWLGSIVYICQPLGSLLSAVITDPLGRKRSMMLVNIPFGIAWFMMYKANSVPEIFIAASFLGLSVGLMESPVVTYIGEICEPTNRGVLIGYTNLSGTIGAFVVFFFNTLMPWRSVGLVCLFLPIFTVIALCFVPETPMWLLAANRTADAEKALCWLRGWAPKGSVAVEFQELQRYSDRSKSCNACIKRDQKCSHPAPSLCAKLGELKRKQTLKPLALVVTLFFVAEFSGMSAMLPFIVQIFKAYDSPMAPDQAAALLSFLNNLANIAFMCLIRFTGKRRLYLTMLSIVFLCSAMVAGYGFAFLPSGFNSFDKTTAPPLAGQLGYIPFFGILLWSFCTYCGVNSLPWQMLSEVFPFKARGIAAGLSATMDYFLSFATTKSYFNLETSLSLAGVSLFYCFICGCGLIVTYLILPETENRTLEDIESHFSDNSKKLTDRKIAKAVFASKGEAANGNESHVQDNKSNKVLNGVNGSGSDNKGFISEV